MDATSLLFFGVLSMSAAVPSADADRAILNAYLSQSGIQSNVNALGKKYEQHLLTSNTRYVAGYLAFVSKTVIDHKLTIQWGF